MILFLILTFLTSCSKNNKPNNDKNNTKFTSKNMTRFCTSPNTKITQDGNCECINSNFYGNPNSPEGCWTCDVKCHYNGICIEPNKCECKKNYFGDGINSCKRPLPNISSYTPNKCNSENTEIYFVASKIKRFKPDEVFCRFGTFISYGEVLNRTYFKCYCPSIRKGTFKSSLSFDNEFWSTQFEIDFNQDSSYSLSLYTYIIMALLIVFFTAAVLWHKRLSFDSRNDNTEVLPLNKWYMHQIQQEIGEESRIVDFISHIITI